MPGLLLSLFVAVAPADAPSELKWLPAVDLPVTITLGVGWLVTEIAFKRPLAPGGCRWCAVNDFDTTVRRNFNPTLTGSLSGLPAPDTASNLVSLVAMPVLLFGLDALFEHDGTDTWLTRWAADLTIIAEATFAAMATNQLVKFSVGRARPYTVNESDTFLATAPDRADQNLSFYSGHTTFAVGLAVSAGMVSTLHGFKYAWVTWAVGVPLATATAFLRLAADKHWATDVIVGAAVGAAFAVALPLIFHRQSGVRVAVQPGGVSLSGSF